jgi:hypothetical protein
VLRRRGQGDESLVLVHEFRDLTHDFVEGTGIAAVSVVHQDREVGVLPSQRDEVIHLIVAEPADRLGACG